MKNKILIIFISLIVLLASSCKNNKAEGTISKDASYAFGMALGSNLKETGLTVDYDSFFKGIKDVIEDKNLKFSFEEASEYIQQSLTIKYAEIIEKNKKSERKFLEQNAQNPNVIITNSGLQYEIIKEGSGEKPNLTDIVQVHYVGTLITGEQFDGSLERGIPAEFALNEVIEGWTEGIQLMKVGSKFKFYIPSQLAYGEGGAGGQIEPYSPLIFEVELLDIIR